MDSTIFLMFVVITVVALLMLGVIGRLARQKSGLDHEWYRAHWKRVEQMAAMGEHGRHMAILEADKLLDKALKTRNFYGETMGERLKTAGKAHVFGKNEAIWKAHKLRNQLAHESDIQVSQMVAHRSLAAFKSGLKDIGAL